jgi:hypothetical protein
MMHGGHNLPLMGVVDLIGEILPLVFTRDYV